MPATRKRCTTTPTMYGRWNTACRPRQDCGWAWTGWSCCTRIHRRFAMSCCSRTCGPNLEFLTAAGGRSLNGEAHVASGEADVPAAETGMPIGVFDSGVGGLTVLRALRSAMPAENFVYLGETARLPYGTKSAETVVRYSLQCAA